MQPSATGTLEKTPFAHLLVYMEQRALSGTLVIWPEGATDSQQGQDRIVLEQGQIVAARLLGPASDLAAGLLPLFSRRSARYAFYDADLAGEAEGRTQGHVDPWTLLARWLRGEDVADDLVIATLSRVGDRPLTLAAQSDLSRFAFLPEEAALAMRIAQSPAPVAALARDAQLPRTRALRVLYLLVVTKVAVPMAVEEKAVGPQPTSTPAPRRASPVSATPEPSTSVPAAPRPSPTPIRPPRNSGSSTSRSDPRLTSIPVPEPGLPDELRERWVHTIEVGKRIETQNFFEMLGIEKTAKSDEIRAAFLKMAKEWHPDRLPKELSALRPYVEIIFGYMSEAHACLSDEKQRLPYIQSVREGGGTPEADRAMQRIVDSAMQYERVLILNRRHDYRAALNLLEEILVATPDEPDYQAMYAWLLLQLHPSAPDSTPPYSQMLAAVDKAIRLHEGHEKAHLCRAQILKSMGKTREAIDGFRRVVEINPNNVEAAREVRIAQMRADSRAPANKKREPSGIFGKLFKKP